MCACWQEREGAGQSKVDGASGRRVRGVVHGRHDGKGDRGLAGAGEESGRQGRVGEVIGNERRKGPCSRRKPLCHPLHGKEVAYRQTTWGGLGEGQDIIVSYGRGKC